MLLLFLAFFTGFGTLSWIAWIIQYSLVVRSFGGSLVCYDRLSLSLRLLLLSLRASLLLLFEKACKALSPALEELLPRQSNDTSRNLLLNCRYAGSSGLLNLGCRLLLLLLQCLLLLNRLRDRLISLLLVSHLRQTLVVLTFSHWYYRAAARCSTFVVKSCVGLLPEFCLVLHIEGDIVREECLADSKALINNALG